MSLRALYILVSDYPNCCLFSRKFPTIENRLKSKMKDDYCPIRSNDKIIIRSFFKQIIRNELLQKEFKYQPYTENIEIDHSKFEELLKEIDLKFDKENFGCNSECSIVTLDLDSNKKLWPCLYVKKYKLYAIAFPNIEYDLYLKILEQKENNVFQAKKAYEEQDTSIILSFSLLENLLNYICEMKMFEENKLHTLISNMIPFGNINETNFTFMCDTLNFHNQNYVNKNIIFCNFTNNGRGSRSLSSKEEKVQTPGWSTVLSKNGSDKFFLEIKEELKFVKFPKEGTKEKYCNVLLCDILCKADLGTICEITLPIKEKKFNCLGNLRVHPCAKIEDMNILNETTRIIFFPPNNKITLGVSEIENLSQNKIPLIASLQLKEANQNEVKIYLKIKISDNAIGNFEYFYITIPLKHFGTIIDTKIMVQVGEVSLINNKSSLLWDLQNKVFDNTIVLSGTIFFAPGSKNENKKNNTGKDNFNLNFNVEKMIKKSRNEMTSDIRDNNCFCKIFFKLNNFSLIGFDIDKKSLLFYPKISPYIEIKKSFFSNEYIVWNDLSFNNYEINVPEKGNIQLLKINIEEES